MQRNEIRISHLAQHRIDKNEKRDASLILRSTVESEYDNYNAERKE